MTNLEENLRPTLVATRKVLLAVCFLLVLGLTLLSPAGSAQAFIFNKNSLVGTWQFTVTTDGIDAPPLQALVSYEKGGTLIISQTGAHENSSEFESICGCNASNGQGSWKRTGSGTYSTKFEIFAFAGNSSSSLGLNLSEPIQAPGQYIGYAIIEDELNVDGDTLTGSSQSQVLNLDGENLNPAVPPFTSSITGTRITVE